MAHGSQNYGSIDQRLDVPDVGFSPTELYSLSDNITANIYTINASFKTLEKAYKNIGTSKDNQGLRDKVHLTQTTTNSVVSPTSKDIARLTVLMRRGDKQQKLQIEKLTADFKDALSRYSDMQKSIAEKMKRHILQNITLMDKQNDNENSERQSLMQAHMNEEKRAQQRTLEFEQGMLLEREDRVKRIEGDILDVNQIMRELGALVHVQSSTIDTIENNIENVHGDVELGAQELIKASNYQTKFRRKICYILIVAVIVILILIISLVTK